MYLTTGEVAFALKFSSKSIRDQCERGELPAVKFGTQWRINKEQLIEYLETGLRKWSRPIEPSGIPNTINTINTGDYK